MYTGPVAPLCLSAAAVPLTTTQESSRCRLQDPLDMSTCRSSVYSFFHGQSTGFVFHPFISYGLFFLVDEGMTETSSWDKCMAPVTSSAQRHRVTQVLPLHLQLRGFLSAIEKACAGMEPLTVDDDICILKHETAYTAVGESPVSVCAGDESVASHFALVTAYEDIKKRLRDTERENTLLRKRVKQLEDKLFRPEAPPSEGPQYVNKAFSAYRGIYIEKEDLQMELNKLKKEKSESERLLTEQLQAKELELLQLRTEMETSQVMKSLNSPQDYWQVNMVSTERKIQKLQEELKRVTLENSRLLERSREEPQGLNGPGLDQICDAKFNARQSSMQQTYEALCCEVTRLHSELKHQTGLIRKLRPLISETRQAAPTVPIQCLDDVEKNNNHAVPRASVPRPPSAPPLPSCSGRPCPPAGVPSGSLLPDSLREDCWYNGPWPSQSCSGEALVGSDTCSAVLPPPPLNQASLDDSSRSFPSPPKPSDAMFWEGHATASNSSSIGNCTPRSPPNAEWTKPY